MVLAHLFLLIQERARQESDLAGNGVCSTAASRQEVARVPQRHQYSTAKSLRSIFAWDAKQSNFVQIQTVTEPNGVFKKNLKNILGT